MSPIDYNGRRFRGVKNYDSGDLTRETLFEYYQEGLVVWGTFSGGGVLKGVLLARVLDDDSLDMVWQYVNRSGQLVRGTCLSCPQLLPDGRLRLHESWIIECEKQVAGESVIEEIQRGTEKHTGGV